MLVYVGGCVGTVVGTDSDFTTVQGKYYYSDSLVEDWSIRFRTREITDCNKWHDDIIDASNLEGEWL